MKGDFHVRVCESLRGEFPWATLPIERYDRLLAHGTKP